MSDERPWASEGREADARRMFPYKQVSPQRYAALESPNIMSSSFDEYRYKDPALDTWIRDMHAVLYDAQLLANARQAHLSADELREVLEREQEPF